MSFLKFTTDKPDAPVPPWILRLDDGKLMLSPENAPSLLQGGEDEDLAAAIERAALFQGFNIGKVSPADDDEPVALAQTSGVPAPEVAAAITGEAHPDAPEGGGNPPPASPSEPETSTTVITAPTDSAQ